MPDIRTPKPEWAGTYTSYEDIVSSWGCEVIDLTRCGSYQGDYVALLRHGPRWAFTTFGYGSCSGCDELEAVTPWGDEDTDWAGVVSLRDRLRDEVTWRDSAADLAAHLRSLDEANHWWMHDDEMKEAVDGYLVILDSEATR